jgi:hypothetical protein
VSRRRSRTRRARRCPRRISLARIFNLARNALSIEKIRYLPTASIRVSRRLNKNCTCKFVELRLTRPVGSSEQLRDGQNPHRLELLHRGDCAVPAKACARNSLTLGQPRQAQPDGAGIWRDVDPELKKRTALALERDRVGEKPEGRALGCDLNAPRGRGSSEFVIRSVRNHLGESRAISRLGLDLDCPLDHAHAT